MLWGSFNGYKVALVQSLEDLAFIRSNLYANILVGCDSETTGLSFVSDYVVGICLSTGRTYSKADYVGYYIPLRHYGYSRNLPIKEVMEFVQFVVDNYMTAWWNRSFDFSMLEKDGFKAPFVGKTHDIQFMAHEVFNDRMPKLKDWAKRFLKFQTISYEENEAENNDFGSTDPEVSFTYACYSADTRFLTRTGFKLFDEISATDEIAQYNPVSGDLEFVLPLRRYDYISDDIVGLKTKRLDCLVSGNHRMYACWSLNRTWFIKPASALYGRQCNTLTVSNGYVGVDRRDPFVFPATEFVFTNRWGSTTHSHKNNLLSLDPDAWIEALGFFLGDGSCVATKLGNSGEFSLMQSAVSHKSDTVAWLRALNVRLGGLFSECVYPSSRKGGNPMIYWRVVHRGLYEWVRANFYTDGVKSLPAWLFDLSKRQRRLFLEAFFRADGSRPLGNRYRYLLVCNNKLLADQILSLCVGVGFNAHMSVYNQLHINDLPGGCGGTRVVTVYRIHLNDELPTSRCHEGSWYRGESQRVVCFSVPSGLLIVERNGKPFVSGNCGDAVMTALLGLKIWSDYPNIRKIYSLDNECGEAVRRMTQQEIYLDYDFLDAELRRSNAQMESLRQQIYQLVGYSFNVDSGPQIAEALGRFVTLTVRTERGGLKVDKNVLATIDHPLAKLLLEYSEVSTYIKSFVSKMCSWRGTPVRINYNLTVALTGRMSSSGSKGNDYYKPFNGQNCLRGSTVVYSDTGAIHLDSVSVGSRVWDGVAFREVTAFYNKGVQDVYRVTLDNGRSIDATLDHPILTKSGFRPVSELLGVFVALSGFVVPNGLDVQDMSTFSWQKVVSISYIGRDVVYDITVSTTHRFAANGIIVHNCPKVEVKAYLHTHPVLGYCLTDSPDGAVCDSDGNPIKYKTKAGLRSAFMPAPKDAAGWVVLGADFAAQEIRVAGNLSREDGFLYPVKHNIDVHLYVAEKRFGVSDPGFRSKSKAVSFGKLYGGGPHLIASRLSISVQAAKELISDYDKGMPRLKAWQEVLKRDAKRTGFARTYFGRTIYLAKWLSSPDNGMRAYAERVSLNAPVQGSLINTIYLPSQDGKSYRPWKDFAGQRVDFVDPLSGVRRMGVPTFRGEEELHVVIFNTGDFVVCNRGHKFVKYGTDDVVIGLDSCGRIPVRVGKPFKRPCFSWLRGIFSRGVFSLEQLAALAHMGRPIAVDDWGIYWGLLKSFLGGKRFHTRSFVTAATLRSVCDLFGWNLVYDFAASSSTDYVFKLCRGRKLKAHAVFAMPLGVTHNIMSPSMCSGLPVYPLCGFVHKNTGGDLIRRDLIRLMRYRDMDPEFAANTRFVVTVHDEIQIASRIQYLAKAVCVLQRIMNFWPSNFEVPLVTEPCVGLTWGYELDIHAVDKKTGKLWPKDFTPPQEYIDSGDWYFVDSWLEQEKAKRGVTW